LKKFGLFYVNGLPLPELPELNVIMVAVTELFGGSLSLLGLFTRPASFFLAFTMVVAFMTAHYESVVNLNTNTDKFFGESAFAVLFTSLVLFLFWSRKNFTRPKI
jgi:putative oxidoreductase